MGLDPQLVFAVTGKLYTGVTNLAIAAPFGGREAGYFEDGGLVVEQEAELILSEAEGKQKGVLLAETIVGFEFDLVQYDVGGSGAALLHKLWSRAGTQDLREPFAGATVSPGLAPSSSPCLFLPDDPQHPGLLIFNPVFRHGRKRVPHGSVDLVRRERVIVDAVDDANGHAWMCDLFGALSLT